MKRCRIKREKSSYLRAFFVGITLCIIVIFCVVPDIERYGLFLGIGVVLITIINWKNAFGKNVLYPKKVKQEKKMEKVETPDESLYELNYLYQENLISYEDYKLQRKKILSRF